MSIIKAGGNLESLKDSVINELEDIYYIDISSEDFLPEELTVKLAKLTGIINREIAVYLDRKGHVIDVSVGDSNTVSLAEVDGRRDESRLAGIRCIHTHPNNDGRLSAVDINSLLTLRLDAMVAIGVNGGKAGNIYAAIPNMDSSTEKFEVFGPYKAGSGRINALMELIRERDKRNKSPVAYANTIEKERCILVGLETSTGDVMGEKSEGERSIDELEELAHTAGAVVVKKILQKRPSRDSAYFVGKGKVEEINLIRQALNANTIIFDHELSGAQFRNIEEVTGVKVIDRTTLILDIFAQRARSKEGKLQVELAQLKYRLPRLAGIGNQLSRLGGGIGTRGPGEKKLEVDRRHIRRRIKYLEDEIEGISKRRGLMRSGRIKNNVPAIALVGYTNAGKSTIMNKLCSADLLAEDKLFATLDPTTRKLLLPDGREALIIDTVGFIRRLPHDLIDAFKSTLEEAVFADILIHVVDASSEEMDGQIKVVNSILSDLGVNNKPVIIAMNKIDLIKSGARVPAVYSNSEVYGVSAVTGEGMEQLVKGISKLISLEKTRAELFVPYDQGWAISHIHNNGKVLEERFTESGAYLRADIQIKALEKVKDFIKSS
ncbi:MAG: GTPase HflX [Acetivibrionales bacterium]